MPSVSHRVLAVSAGLPLGVCSCSSPPLLSTEPDRGVFILQACSRALGSQHPWLRPESGLAAHLCG